MTRSKIDSYIGLAIRSGSAIFGEDRISQRVTDCLLVLVDADAPENYRTRLSSRLGGNTPYFEIDNLVSATHRDNVRSVGITSKSLAEAIINLLR